MTWGKTILGKIGITDQEVQGWKRKRLTITYPMRASTNHFISQDGKVFIESADKYVPPLTPDENRLYTKSPETFQKDFLKNVELYSDFHTHLYKVSESISKIKAVESKLAAALALMYLFLSAMDHHYYHFDRYLAYEDYPNTPVGFWWKKMKKIFYIVYGEQITKSNTPKKFLELLSLDSKILTECRRKLSSKGYQELLRTLEVVKIFEKTQEKEVRIVSGYPAKEDLLFKTGFGIWDKIWELVNQSPSMINSQSRSKILRLQEGHPIMATRELLLVPQLKSFSKEIYIEFEREIKRWIFH